MTTAIEQSFDILRLNTGEKTITVLLKIGESRLQEDVAVEDFVDMKAINEAVGKRLDKFAEDLKTAEEAQNVTVNPELQALVNKHTKPL